MARDELEQVLGARIRALRAARRLTQIELAERANVSVGALKHLESGAGATTATLVKVLRSLGEQRWLHTLGPSSTETFNPLQVLQARQRSARAARPSRVRRQRGETP